jgi:hypothetical protein
MNERIPVQVDVVVLYVFQTVRVKEPTQIVVAQEDVGRVVWKLAAFHALSLVMECLESVHFKLFY